MIIKVRVQAVIPEEAEEGRALTQTRQTDLYEVGFPTLLESSTSRMKIFLKVLSIY